ncbi:MAG: DNA polymerase III subunit gamma/tau [Candidatus Gottesmanbacteria bacterium]
MVVLYRKYRPQKISEIDSPLVRQKLETILNSNRVPHAFLFSGPKGTGKTSSARIIAKSINCEKNDGKGEPCNKCNTCLSITNGSNVDILEIDAASNRGIDEIRELRDKIKYSPANARKKIYIIDEVHMLTNEAFNALLKTLEEPPEHALFILCTTNTEKLPETIIDRCTRIDFKKATTADLVESLKRVKKGEDRDIDKEALIEIAKLSEGSYRDSHKLIEEVMTMYPRANITLELVKKVLGERETNENLFNWINPTDPQKGLAMMEKLAEKGSDFKFICQTILDTLHAHLLRKYNLIEDDFIYYDGLNNLTPEQLKNLIVLFSQASQEIKTAIIPQLPLELAIVEWCEGIMKSEGGDDEIAGDEFSHPVDVHAEVGTNIFSGTKPDAGAPPPAGPSFLKNIVPPHANTTVGLSKIEQKWEEILIAIKPYNHSVAGLLHSCKPANFDGQRLNLEVFYKFHYDKLSEPKIMELLDKIASEIFGDKIIVIPEFKPKK